MDRKMFIEKLTYDFALDYLKRMGLDNQAPEYLEEDLEKNIPALFKATNMFYSSLKKHESELKF